VRSRILAGDVTPGSIVTELAVATEFGVAQAIRHGFEEFMPLDPVMPV
jgi:hypothetical protein